LELGFGKNKIASWTSECNDTNPDYNTNSCDGHTFSVPVYGLDAGNARAVIYVSAYDSVNNTTGSKTANSSTYTVR
jgi:hypothetical protein